MGLIFMKNLSLIPQIENPTYQEFLGVVNPEILKDLARTKGYISCLDFLIFSNRLYFIHWVIKLRFNSKYKLPMKREVINYSKPFGVLYAEIFKGCERLHSFTNGQYRNAAHWFGLIMIERRSEGLNRGTKAKTLEQMRNESGKLGQFRNPFEQEYPHTYYYFQLLLSMSGKNDIFRKEVLEPIKKARKALATAYYKSDGQVGYVDDQGQEFRQLPKRGSGKKKLPILLTWEDLDEGLKKMNF